MSKGVSGISTRCAPAAKPEAAPLKPLAQGDYDIIMVGAGNNGLIVGGYLAKAGLNTLVLEARDFVGGGVVTREATAPGFLHDLGATAAGWLDMNPIIAADELGMVQRSKLKFLPPPEVQEVQIFQDGVQKSARPRPPGKIHNISKGRFGPDPIAIFCNGPVW